MAEKAKIQMNVNVVNQTADTTEVLVTAEEAGKPVVDGTEISFDYKVKDEPIAIPTSTLGNNKTKDGKLQIELPIRASEAPIIHIRARTVKPGGSAWAAVRSTDFRPAADPKQLKLSITENRLKLGMHLKTFAVYDAKTGKGVGGQKVRLLPKNVIYVQGEDGAMVRVDPYENHFWHDITVDQDGCDMRITTPHKDVEVDVRILGYDVHEEMRLFGPGVELINADEDEAADHPTLTQLYHQCEATGATLGKRLGKLVGRTFLAWLFFTITMVGVLAMMPVWVPVGAMAVLGVILIAFAAIAPSLLNPFPVRFFLQTNNRLWLWMVGLVIGMTVLLFFTDIGKPLANTAANAYLQETKEWAKSENQRKLDNIRRFGSSDIEPQDQQQAKPAPPTMMESIPEDPRRDVWDKRLIVLSIMVVMTVIYIVAFWDELVGLWYSGKRTVLEKAEGSAGQAVSNAASTVAKVGAATAVAASPGIAEVGKQLVGNALEHKFWDTVLTWRRR